MPVQPPDPIGFDKGAAMQRVIAAIVTFCFTTTVLASDWPALSALDQEPRAMLYFKQSLGSQGRHEPAMRFGLRLDRAASDFGSDPWTALGATPFETTFAPTVPLTDFYVTTAGDHSFSISGVAMYDTSLEDTAFTGDSWSNFWFWVTAAAVSLGILCLAETWVCEKERRERETETPETPGD
jgi:hypothetical protein